MAKINITKPTGITDTLNLINAFKAENNIYVILDGEKMGSIGLPIIYVSKYTTKLEKINDENEWQSVKNYLKGIISGANFEYIKISDNITADEVYYTPLTLPQNSFETIKSRYVVAEDSSTQSGEAPTLMQKAPEISPIMPDPNIVSNTNINISPVASNDSNIATINPINEGNNNEISQNSLLQKEIIPESEVIPKVEDPSVLNYPEASNLSTSINNSSNAFISNFENDKETFLKACENMFDALISKYQKELSNLEEREKVLAKKEAEINAKLQDASEHLANAEAREQVANIAHDNAKKVMDLNNFMPVNSNQGTIN